jgi:hypothetical protein
MKFSLVTGDMLATFAQQGGKLKVVPQGQRTYTERDIYNLQRDDDAHKPNKR